MLGPRCRRLLLLAICSSAVLGTTGLAAAACPSRPPPPCKRPPAFAGSANRGTASTHASSCARTHKASCAKSQDRGPRGKRGLQGVTGTTGAAGRTGATGERGWQGIRGATGADGADGPQGADGADGDDGADGVAGPPGPAVSEYAYIYNLTPRTVAIDDPYAFDTNGAMTTGITHVIGTSEITLNVAGTYKVSYTLTAEEANQMALFLGEAPIDGSIYGSEAGAQPNTGQAIITVPGGALLSLRNYSSDSGVSLPPSPGGTQPNTNASITIEKLS
jgi:BclA C-terminal domain/Collagen triple helix repeat (20 copies)